MSTSAQLAGFDVVSWSLALPRVGVGTLVAEVDLDEGEAPPAGTVDFVYTPEPPGLPVSYRVTVIDVLAGGDMGRQTLGRFEVFCVQGAGGLRRALLEGVDYAEIAPRKVVEDLLREAGELDGELDALDALGHLARWVRPVGSHRAALARLCQRLDMPWRMQPSGRVRVAPEAWPAYGTEPPLYTTEPDAAGVAELALDAPDLLPGMAIPRPEGQVGAPYYVSSVVHACSEDGDFRTRAQLELPAAAGDGAGEGTKRGWWRKAVQSVLPPLAFHVPHRATVVDQDSDGMLGLRFDDPGAPVLTLSAVPIWPGFPGAKIDIEKGARVLVQFAGGQEDVPLVTGFEPRAAFKAILLGPGDFPEQTYGTLKIGSATP